MTFFLIDLCLVAPAEFVEEAIEAYGESIEDAVERWASCAFSDETDGLSTEVLIADNPEGTDAKKFEVVQRVHITYEALEVR